MVENLLSEHETNLQIDPDSIIFQGDFTCAGIFAGGQNAVNLPDFPDKGVVPVLSSGNPNNLPGQDDDTSAIMGQSNDADLDNLPGVSTTEDACILEFEFICNCPDACSMELSFVFGSEEYSLNNKFNDVFAWFLNGNAISFVPNTASPISVDSINNSTNAQYYIDNNIPSVGGAPYPKFEAYGFTTLLTSQGQAQTNGVINTMKLAIADTGDNLYDSWVLLAMNSLRTTCPTRAPSSAPSNFPSESFEPSIVPSSTPTQSDEPSTVPSETPVLSHAPSTVPSDYPSNSAAPSFPPSNASTEYLVPSTLPSNTPTETVGPSLLPSDLPTESMAPSDVHSNSPTSSIAPTSVLLAGDCPDPCDDFKSYVCAKNGKSGKFMTTCAPPTRKFQLGSYCGICETEPPASAVSESPAPSGLPSDAMAPSVSAIPSAMPTDTMAPSSSPSALATQTGSPSVAPSGAPTDSVFPSWIPSSIPSALPTET
eukprot:scaffold2103_cov185-Amphora_coffeaeformis.AAC.42